MLPEPKQENRQLPPEALITKRIRNRKDKDEFFVVACDGIYDVMENEERCRFAENRLHVCDGLNQVCNNMLDACRVKYLEIT
ncbi:hypothetical protein GCK32_005950 [Trichostrongylus colubriformis]|uniref:PPM-type phosphatase domain-containing protein n=1 Tax=Trichostrongylus colubriformis TaxID=6319 RepID=A0AAN8FE96_TRICO